MHYTYFQRQLEERLKYFIKANADASTEKCQAVLVQLEATLRAKLKNGDYSKNGGFAEFQQDLMEIQRKYKNHTDLGVQVCVESPTIYTRSRITRNFKCGTFDSK